MAELIRYDVTSARASLSVVYVIQLAWFSD
jgi:hypothetical protein